MTLTQTIQVNDLELDVEFDYQPYEPPERGPEAQYPGCQESFDITAVWVNGRNIIEICDLREVEERLRLDA